MKFVTVKEHPPKENTWYLVKAPNYSESGFEIAEWDGEEWQHGHFSQSCNPYVISYSHTPINEM